jgi:membrane protease YdiL (CAAX protease family)
MNRRGVLWFLGITFAVTYAIELALIAAGFRIEPGKVPLVVGQYVILLVMWVPAVATFITTRWVTREGMGGTMLRFGSWKPYVAMLVVVPLCFAVIYGLTWALGLAEPDWQLNGLYEMMRSYGTDMSAAPAPSLVLLALLVGSVTFGPIINSVIALGEEVGWRGYLLPKLVPLGMPAAHLVSGVIWGLWHAPIVLVGFNYPGRPLAGVVGMCCLTTAIGITLNVLTLRYRSSLLAAWIHGVFNAQAYGIWRVLFPTANPLIGGFTGLIGILVFLVLGGAGTAVSARGADTPE